MKALLLAIVALAALPLGSCQTVRETGRSQLKLIPPSVLVPMSLDAYEQETAKYPRIERGPVHDMVQRVGQRVAAASGLEAHWEFRLLDATQVVNAFALPGGKVAVYTGLLGVTQNEDALAAVLGHEVAHVTAGHGNERMSHTLLQKGVIIGADMALDWKGLSPEDREDWLLGLAVGTELGVKGYSRLHESEADEIGLRYLVRAGYDPNEAPLLWERMAQLSGGTSGVFDRLLATHPEPERRAKRLRELIPEIVAEESPARP
jgi:predicted Zn-dependent protease